MHLQAQQKEVMFLSRSSFGEALDDGVEWTGSQIVEGELNTPSLGILLLNMAIMAIVSGGNLCQEIPWACG